MEHSKGFEAWALVEIMGHQRIAGLVTEQEIGGSKFVRVDVPDIDGRQAVTKFYGPQAIYGISPVSEETARELAKRIDVAPVSAWDARHLAEQIAKKPAQLNEPHDVDDEPDPEENESDIPY